MEIMNRYKKLGNIASTDECIDILNYIHIDKLNDKPVAIATDGRRLVIVPLENVEDYEHDAYIHRSAWKEMFNIPHPKCVENIARKFVIRKKWINAFKKNITLRRRNEVVGDTVLDKIISHEQPNGTYPNIRAVIPAKDKDATFIGLDAKLLYEIAQAFGGNYVTLQIKDHLTPIRITSHADPEVLGVLMPLRID